MNPGDLTLIPMRNLRALLRTAALFEDLCDTVDQEDLEECGAPTAEDVDERLGRIRATIPDGQRVLHLIPGLPGSGKTTMALGLQEQDPGLVRVSKDQIRRMLFGETARWTPRQEALVRANAEQAVVAAVAAGWDVVCDATLLTHLSFRGMFKLAEQHGVEVLVHPECLRVPADTCIERDGKRGDAGGRSVGEAVIVSMASMVEVLWGEYL